MFRPVHRLLAKVRKAKAARKAAKAARALSYRGVDKHDDARQALIDKLCGELGRQPFKLSRRA